MNKLKSRVVFLITFGLLAIHLFLLVNLRFTAWPEMLSFPYLRNNGYLLYKDMIHPYPPLLTMALAYIYEIFGYKLIVLKAVTWGIILVNDVLIFLIGKSLTKSIKYSLLGLISYILLQPFLDGNMLWFDLAIVPPILLGTLFFLNKKYFWSGVALAFAALTKQTAGLFLVFSSLFIVLKTRKIRDLFYFLSGPVVLFLILVLRLITEGALAGFINWTLVYPFTFWGKFPGYVQMALSRHQLLILVLLVIPVILLVFRLRRSLFKDKNLFFLVSSILVSVILIYPRFSFFHFQTGIAFIAVLFGILAKKLKFHTLHLTSYFLLLFLVISLPVIKSDWRKETRFWSESDIELANIIKSNTAKDDLIYLQDIHSNLYVLAGRLPPKPWTDNFGWFLEVPGVQVQIIGGWDKNKPKYVFVKDILPGNWYDLGTYRPKKIADWINNNYLKKEEIQTGVWLWEEK